MVNRYALSDYIFTIYFPEQFAKIVGMTSLSIGGAGEAGEGSFVGEIKVSRKGELWSTDGDTTGSWVHNLNLDKTGTCELSIKQISDNIIKLAQICNFSESSSTRPEKGFEITVVPDGASESEAVSICYDCYIQKIPDQVFGETASMQSWVFTCGQVTFPLSK